MPIKILASNSVDTDKLILSFTCKGKRPRMVNTTFQGQSQRTDTTQLQDLLYSDSNHDVVLHWPKKRQINETEQNPEIAPLKHSQLVFAKKQRLCNGAMVVLSAIVLKQLDSHLQKTNLSKIYTL